MITAFFKKSFALAPLLLVALFPACGGSTDDDTKNIGDLPEPSGAYCASHGGSVEIRTEAAGQYGVCKFYGGSECDTWAFYRGECKPGDCTKWETCKLAADGGAADVSPTISAPQPSTATQEALRLGITSSPASIVPTVLPSELTDANWGVKKIACSEGGYDLNACAGQSVTLTSFRTTEQSAGCVLDLWIVSKDATVCCAYKAVGQTCAGTPGVYPAKTATVSVFR